MGSDIGPSLTVCHAFGRLCYLAPAVKDPRAFLESYRFAFERGDLCTNAVTERGRASCTEPRAA